MKIHKKTIFPMLCIWYLLISEILFQVMNTNILLFQYSDEIVTICFFLYIVLALFQRNISSDNLRTILFIFIVLVLGGIANFTYNIQKSNFAVFLDMVSFAKIFICFIGVDIMTDNMIAERILKSLTIPAKLILYTGIPLGIISQFYDIGMRGQFRYGVWGFNYIFGYAHIYSVILIVCVIILGFNEIEHVKINRYLFLASVQMLMTTKGPSIIWMVMILIMLFYYKYFKKIRVGMLIVLGGVCLFLGKFQIENYLLNTSAPRYLFFKYGLITAKEYFPLGAGFATFGSDMAAKYYSPLYYQYGFNLLHGLSPTDTSFLNDNYWQMIMAQFGFIALILVAYIYFLIYKKIQASIMPKSNKTIIFSAFVYLMVHSIGSAILTSSSGVILFIFIILAFKVCENKYE